MESSSLSFATICSVIAAICSMLTAIICYKNHKLLEKQHTLKVKQYMENIVQEKEKNRKFIQYINEMDRTREEPYLMFSGVIFEEQRDGSGFNVAIDFTNKGRGSAYKILPETRISGITEINIPIEFERQLSIPCYLVLPEQSFRFFYTTNKIPNAVVNTKLELEDSTGRKYIQKFKLDLSYRYNKGIQTNAAQPEMVKDIIPSSFTTA